jgi:LmbE family N-acetylglucosaminyl deacetylase
MGEIYVPESAMAIVAHPDDIEFSCAGTLARWVKGGSRVSYVLCTSGEVGISESGMTKKRAVKIREAEQRKAAEIAGAQEVIFLHEPDGLLQPTLDLRKKLVREIRRFRPEVVITGDPTIVWTGNEYINHPDHRAAASAALDATFPAAGQPNLFEELEKEGFTAYKPRKVFVTTWTDGDIYVSIDKTIDTKIEALRAHASQMKDWDPEPRIREWASSRAKRIEASYAETFRVITLVKDEDWEKSRGEVLPEDTP